MEENPFEATKKSGIWRPAILIAVVIPAPRPLNFCRNLLNRHSGENRNPVISKPSGPRLSPG
ncbi:MAG: hypothetical protein CO013_10530 [Syntrophobacterales bacterium CG_4_8_14_3_um_filter_58_8]|nr:MAG: hypothetical protein AUK26_03345 [Syntrophaceae bacterium CG2_30_58_14]PIV05723.1 MAG: hypothetical protein COS57_06845 [Syntrophobacterales bacterium CG03_land_8_20_14_0_80_58_14]PJC72205.1 MAG: hypothetical protein CO013_10530 [Syntrophobacterales bacterium CG_4_8_14_3_um_filter_58_8]